MAAVACGQPHLPLKVNLVALVLYLPALYWLVNQYGISGAAAAYAGLNAYYIFTLLPLVQARVMRQGYGVWLRANLLPFLFAGVVAFGSAKILALAVQPGLQTAAVVGVGVALYVAIAWFLLSDALRTDFANLLKRLTHR
jgi:O-antigen/teichoic acid export membrane protein